jgi:D-alanyl-D-alanine carboxypeptidase/D-alanyl-D-alanine-endopeptidase (penicillin-binding protein 4)
VTIARLSGTGGKLPVKKTPITSYRSATTGSTLGHNADTFMTIEGFFLFTPRLFHPPQQ